MNNWKLLMNNTWVLYDNKKQPVAQIVRQGTLSNNWRARAHTGWGFDFKTTDGVGAIKGMLEAYLGIRSLQIHT